MRRRWLFWLLILAFIWLAVSRFTEIEKLAETLAQGQWQWVLAALVLQILYYVVYTELYQTAFTMVEVQSRLWKLLPVTFGSIFVNVVAPSGGASGAALFVDDAARRGQSSARATAGTLLVLIADLGAFTFILVMGLVFLFSQHDLKLYEIVGAMALLAITGGLTGVLALGIWRPDQLRRVLGWLHLGVNRLAGWLRRPSFLAEGWSEKNAAEFSEAAQAIAAHPTGLGRILAVALIAHFINLISFYLLFRAFQQPIRFGPLVAGYSMAILFLIVSPTPMGIGFVEGITPLVLISLGIPAATATIVTLAFRGLSFWIPLAVGFFLIQQVKSFSAEEHVQARLWDVRIVALLTVAMGLINILSAITPSLADRLALITHFSPLIVRNGGRLTAALAGFALLLLANGLWRRKQTAWLLTLIVLIISVNSHLLKGLDYEEAILAAGLAAWLFYLRPHFQALSDMPSIKRGIQVLLAAFIFTLVYSALGFYLLDRHFQVNFGLWAALRQTLIMFTQFYDPGLEPLTGFGRYFAASIYIVGAVTVGYALLALIRPVLLRESATPEQRRHAQTIVETYGHSGLARMALFEDKSYYFSPGGSVIAYVARGRGATALGDPIGPPEDAAATIIGFRDFCSRHDWTPAFWQVKPDYLKHYCAAGFKLLGIGQEAIIDLASFSLAGGSYKSIRSTVNRLTRLGYRAEVHQPPLSEILLEELRTVSDEWLTMMHGREKRFSLGWFDDDYIRNAPVIAVHTPEGMISAFANLVPEYQLNEITADLMRRRSDIENGTMDFLFVSLFEWAKIQGYASFSLGLSPFSGVGEQPDDPKVEQALHFIFEHVNQFYNFKGLHEFKEKFHPRWSPRYLVYPSPASLPTVAMTLNRASTGDDFIWQYLKDFSEKQLKLKH